MVLERSMIFIGLKNRFVPQYSALFWDVSAILWLQALKNTHGIKANARDRDIGHGNTKRGPQRVIHPSMMAELGSPGW